MTRFHVLLLVAVTVAPTWADDWTGKRVLPTRHSSEIQFGDWVNGQKVYWEAYDLLNCRVRADDAGFLRVHDGRREGWVDKDDFVLVEDAAATWAERIKANPNDTFALCMRGIGYNLSGENDLAIQDFNQVI